MIGYLSGIARSKSGNSMIVDVNGVGYRLFIPITTAAIVDQPISLFVHTHVREDEISLYGFSTSSQLDLFETLISVSGIGPKIGLTLISSADVASISNAITTGNVNFFTAIPGIGKKGAQRLIIELRSKLVKSEFDLTSLDQNSDLADALLSLGFKAAEIKSALTSANPGDPLESQIKQALKQLTK